MSLCHSFETTTLEEQIHENHETVFQPEFQRLSVKVDLRSNLRQNLIAKFEILVLMLDL